MADKIIVKNRISDLLAFVRLVSIRKKKIRAASSEKLGEDPVNKMVHEMHPGIMHLRITKVIEETESTKTFRLEPEAAKGTTKLATFRAGQYLNVRFSINENPVTRNYSISSTPSDATKGFYEITVRRKVNGYATGYIFNNWKEGTLIESSGPQGTFVYEGLRDKNHVVAIAGGCGITPIYSMAKDCAEKRNNVKFTILYGVRNSQDIVFKNQLTELEKKYGDIIKIHYIASEPDNDWKGFSGFITAKIITELTGQVGDKSYFICGPHVMYSFLDKELELLNLPRRLVRRELFGEVEDPSIFADFPKDNLSKNYSLKVHLADEVFNIKASGSETILIALERAGMAPPSRCRSGECGWCRAKLLSGEIYISPMNDGRRIADKKFGWIHPCSSYPLSDIEIRAIRSV